MRKMKRIVAIALLIASLFMVAGCEKTAEEKINESFENVDREKVDKILDDWHKSQARENGDTYCKDCEKFIEGKVRICPYCGKYI